MSEIKQINTGVAELIAVKVPVTGMKYNLETDGYNYILFFGEGKDMKVRLLHSGYKYEIVGISDQLIEEQLKEILPSSVLTEMLGLYKTVWFKLMQKHKCYSVNPHTHPSKLSPLGCNKKKQMWEEAEANTGPWLILTKIK